MSQSFMTLVRSFLILPLSNAVSFRCGGMYCGIHRYSDKHECSFDYNALGKAEISAANPVIVAEKVAKI